MTKENAEVVLRWWEELWNRGELPVADELHTPDFRDHDPASPWVKPGPEGMKEKVGAYPRAFPDLRFTMEKVLSADDHVVTHWRCNGTHRGEVLGLAPTGKTIEIEGIRRDDGWTVRSPSGAAVRTASPRHLLAGPASW